MQTLRKLPTMQPSVKKESDQKWNGTVFQMAGSNINGLLQRGAHLVERRRLATPDFQSLRSLVKQHAQTVGHAATGGSGSFEKRRFGGAIDQVENRPGPVEWKGRFVPAKLIFGL